ncbi:ABC transporter ATP-binding protein [Sulfitobacter dubius]|uniref:High-affinity branched-chain amino acid transport ATP-binding protein LivF n=1 Tax=Sulfitobacter dubius TaxID=218673 RepID=A0ABY3ZMP5_9RHOB|nr:ABC transporter ATP-binding protein [Sulfitobacter dubius]UOA15888.1 High-affinity branched-chain amino acid transport ATP-binding protein LivF [Sulfitobacter dubius]
MSKLLDVQGIRAGYGAVPVLHGIDIHLSKGEAIGLFGPNGHGKSTLLRVISGLLRPSEGKIAFDELDVTDARPATIVAAGLVHAQQGNAMFGDMGVEETLELSAFSPRAREGWKERLEEVHALFPRLAERRRQRARTLSGGERQMLSIGCAMMCAPRLLILDEPTLGLSPRLKSELREAIDTIAKKGVPLIVVEQDVEFLLALTQRLYLIEQGEVVREIDQDNTPDHQEIMDMYFGEQAH